MRSKSAYLLTTTVAVLIFGIATDKASSHKLSSLAVRAFDGAVGTAIELVKPSSDDRAQTQRSTEAERPSVFSSTSQLQSPALAHAQTIEAAGPEATPAEVPAATAADAQNKDDEDAQKQAGAFPGRFSGARSSFNGGALGGRRSAEGSGEGQEVGPADVTAGDSTDAPLTALMEVVMSELDRDYGAHTVGSTLDFTPTAKSTAPRTRSSRSESPNSSDAQPSSGPEATQPAAFNPSPVPMPALPEPAASGTSPAIGPSSNNPNEAFELPTPPFESVVDLGATGLLPVPGGPSTEVNDLLILPSNIAPPGLVAPTPPSEVDFVLDTPTIVNPEPATLVLFGTGLAFVAQCARRRRERASSVAD